jgi:hypothetical protein
MLVPWRDHVVLGGSAQPEPVSHSVGDSLSHSLGDSITHPIAESVGQPVSHFVSYLMALGNGKHLGTPGEPPAAEKRRARSRRTRRAPRISAPSLH